QRFMLSVRHPDRREIACAMRARQLLRIAPVRLHTIARRLRNQRRSNDDALEPETGQLPVQREPRRARFVANTQVLLLAKLSKDAANRSNLVRHGPQRPHLAAHFSYGNHHRRSMYIQPHKLDILRHRPALLSFWLCAWSSQFKSNPRLRMREPVVLF